MNADLVITIVFAGTVLLVALLSLAVVVPRLRRQDADPDAADARAASGSETPTPATGRRHSGKTESDAAVH